MSAADQQAGRGLAALALALALARARARARWLGRELAREPLRAGLALVALGIGIYVIVGPLWVARYPMMTDLPFHASNAAIFRHYWDPAWHFREQFTLQPLAVPYLSLYLIAAALMVVLPAVTAVKVAAAVMLAQLPIGLAVLCWGMRKSPLWGLAGLALVWGGLTSWGFLNFVAAVGLFAMVVGLALRLLDRPSRRLQWGLGAALVAVFVTHVFRFPFAVAAVIGSAIVMLPATRRWRPVVAPLIVPLALFALWWWIRPAEVSSDLGPLRFEPARLAEIERYLYRSLRDPAETQAAERALDILTYCAIGAGGLFIAQGRWHGRSKRDWAWGIGVTVIPLCCAGVFLLLYLMLPMEIGIWWYVYPREITAAVFLTLGVLPDLPKSRWLQAAFVAALAVAVVPLGKVSIDNHAQFHEATADFDVVIEHLPQAPKLLYLIYDHSGSTALRTPFIHLPAYVQATRGGWLSFHFSTWGTSPVVFRKPDEPGAVVAPPTPLRWEWTPQKFRVERHGAFFDWFLVRRRSNPARLFRADPTIVPVAHEGSWWLFRRDADRVQSPR